MEAVEKPIVYFSEFLGCKYIPQDDGSMEVELQVKDNHLNLSGTVHGAVICALMDNSIGRTLNLARSDGISGSTIHLNVTFLRPARKGLLRGKARVVRSGKRLSTGIGEVYDESGHLVATAVGTWSFPVGSNHSKATTG